DGGWYAAGELIREHDPWSVAKIVLIHSANAQARAYYSLFPAAVFIQWDVLATMLGSPLIDADLVNAVLAEVRPGAREEELVEPALRIRGSETGDKKRVLLGQEQSSQTSRAENYNVVRTGTRNCD